MAYRINEIFYSLQGEGFWTGTPAVFVRFSGCNLRCPFCDTAHQTFTPMSADDIVTACSEASEGSVISGTPRRSAPLRPDDRRVGITGPPRISDSWGVIPGVDTPPDGTTLLASAQAPIVVLTGGEPGLQVDEALMEKLHEAGYRVHIETNGTVALPEGIDWITLSPKENVPGLKGDGRVVLERADEVKLVFEDGMDEAHPVRWAAFPATWHFLQPCDVPGEPEQSRRNTEATLTYIKIHPIWRLSLQTHKFLGIR